MGFQIRLLFLICYITIINYFDRSAAAFAILPIKQELGFNNAEFGMILGAFGIGYLPMSFISGYFLDRFGSIRLWAMGAALWSLCTTLFGCVSEFWAIFALRVILGVAEGLHFPALLKTITDWLEPSYRARAISFALLGVPLASMIGSPLLTFLMQALSWRWMFIILGGLGFIWVCVWPIAFRNRKNPHYSSARAQSHPERFWKIATHPPFIRSCIAYFAFGYIVFFGLLWLPGFLEEQMHITIRNTGMLLMIPWGFSALMILSGGFISDHLWHKTKSLRKARTSLVIGGLCCAAISFSLIPMTSSLPLITTLLSLGLGSAFLLNAPLYALTSDLFPNRAATAQGIMTGWFALSGITAPIFTGMLVKWSGSFDAAFIFMTFICLCGISALLSFKNDP